MQGALFRFTVMPGGTSGTPDVVGMFDNLATARLDVADLRQRSVSATVPTGRPSSEAGPPSLRARPSWRSCRVVIERLQSRRVRHQDLAGVRCLAQRLERQDGAASAGCTASLGNLGDVKPVGKGVVEMREHFGPGWRMYFTLRGTELIVMVGGGEKSSQRADIAVAQRRAAMIAEERS